MKKRNIALALTVTTVVAAVYAVTTTPQIMTGDYTTPIILDGHSYDGTIIDGAVIHDTGSDGIVLRNVDNVIIRNCTIYNVANGILFRSTGSTNNTLIENCTIRDTTSQGIMVKTDDLTNNQTGVVIRNNRLLRNGINDKIHGMYIMGLDTQVLNNYVEGSSGNGISMRSSGVVSGNVVKNTVKTCIRYFSDHKSGASQKLVIENNVCLSPATDQPGISLLYGGNLDMVNEYIIRFNTVVSSGPYGFAVESSEFSQYEVALYGNLFAEKTFSTAHLDYSVGNYFSLVNNLNPDYTLPTGSPAIGFASGVRDFPALDIAGSARNPLRLDAGAFAYFLAIPQTPPSTAIPATPIFTRTNTMAPTNTATPLAIPSTFTPTATRTPTLTPSPVATVCEIIEPETIDRRILICTK